MPLKEKEIEKLKNAKNLDEIIKIANDLKLNVKKVSLKTTKIDNFTNLNTNIQKPQLPQHQIIKEAFKEKISKKDLKPIVKKTEIHTHKKQINNKDILSSLLLNDIKETHKKKKQSTPKPQNHLHQPSPNIINELKANQVLAKESIKQFSSKLHEAIQDYKPPISRLSLELHPKELGKVEVTITHRGDNIHVQVNSNNLAVGFLNNQQDTLRQALVNLGYSEVNMSFNSNKDQRNRDTYKQNQKLFKEEDEDELVIDIPIYA